MKVIEILKISKEILEMLSENDIKTTDVKHLKLYSEYEAMMAKSLKVTYIVEHLSEEYGLNPKEELSAYLQGELGRKLFPAASIVLCPHCNN